MRKELKGAQTEFLQVVSELDGPSVDVEWTEASLPRPIVTKSSKKPKSIRVKQQGQASASEQTQGENITSSTCVKCGCLSGESARNAVADRSRMCQENTQESSESSATQGLNVIKAQVYKKVQTDLKLCLSDEELAKRVACEDGEASQAKHSLLSEKAVPCLTVEHLQVNFPEGSDSHEKDSTVKRSQGLHVQDGADVGELHELSNNSAVKSTPVPHVGTTDSPTPTNPTITLTPISSSTTATTSSLLGERSVGSVTSPAVDSSTATSEPVSEGGAGSKMRMMDSLHGDQTSIWDSSSSVNQGKSYGKESRLMILTLIQGHRCVRTMNRKLFFRFLFIINIVWFLHTLKRLGTV